MTQEHIDEFWKLMDQIAGNKLYGEACQDFKGEESAYTQQILADKYKPLTALVDTLVGFLRESVIVMGERIDSFGGNKEDRFHHLLLLRSWMLRAQAVRKLLTSGYNAEAIGLTRTLWEILELLPALRKNIVSFDEWLGGKMTQNESSITPHDRRKLLKKKRKEFEKKLGAFRHSILTNWSEEEKDDVAGWMDLMHGALHRNQLEFAFSKHDLEGAKLSLSIEFEERRVQSSLNFFIFTLCGLIKDLRNSPIFPSTDQEWSNKYARVEKVLKLFCQESPMKSGQSILKYIDCLVAMKSSTPRGPGNE